MVEAADSIFIPCLEVKHADVAIDCERSILTVTVDVERSCCLKVHSFGDVPINHGSIEPPVGNVRHNPRRGAVIFCKNEKASLAACIENLRSERA